MIRPHQRSWEKKLQALWMALVNGTSGLAIGYTEELWDTSDLVSLLRLIFRKVRPMVTCIDVFGSVVHRLTKPFRIPRRFDLDDDRRHIAAHYDLPHDVFESMLDPSLTYSCAIFDDSTTTLEEAQHNKIKRIATQLELSDGDRLLDIGCGWGAFALSVADEYGCRVTATTISASQMHAARRRIAEANLQHLVSVEHQNYRELTGQFDRISAIEMIEAVDWRYHDEFFRTCHELLVPDGIMVVQAITIRDSSFERSTLHRDVIRKTIFPGSCIPSLASLTASASKAGFSIDGIYSIGDHYSRTLKIWRENLNEHYRDSGTGPITHRKRFWEFYLAYCEAGFREHHIGDVQMTLSRS